MSFAPFAQPQETQQPPPNVWLLRGGSQGQMQNDGMRTSAREQQSVPPQVNQFTQPVVMQQYPAFSVQQNQTQGSNPSSGKHEFCTFCPRWAHVLRNKTQGALLHSLCYVSDLQMWPQQLGSSYFRFVLI
jgi:hypothetical protein